VTSDLPEVAMRRSDESAPTASAAVLKLRAQLLQRIRHFFVERGFLEVETPVLSADTVVDRHLDPLSVVLYDDPRQPNSGRTLWLQTSPEFAMKRLVAAHGMSIFQVTHAFRAGERGQFHNPEFTMLEWYEVGADYRAGMKFLDDLSSDILHRGRSEYVSYREAFQQHAGIDPLKASLAELSNLATARNVSVPASLDRTDRDAWLELLLVECVEKNLGAQRPVILYDYPESQAALARVRKDEAVAERFELYVNGVELANGYHELLDADVLLKRAQQNNELRVRAGKQPLPASSRLIDAMRHGMPACTGVALGFDRLVMLVAGAKTIDEVIPFPIERA